VVWNSWREVLVVEWDLVGMVGDWFGVEMECWRRLLEECLRLVEIPRGKEVVRVVQLGRQCLVGSNQWHECEVVYGRVFSNLGRCELYLRLEVAA